MLENTNVLVAVIANKVKNSWYSKSQCNGQYTLKSSAIQDLLKVAIQQDSLVKTEADVTNFVRSKMNKKTTKWYAGELAVAINWLAWQYYHSTPEDELSRFYSKMYEEYMDWVYNKSDNDEMIEFVYWFLN